MRLYVKIRGQFQMQQAFNRFRKMLRMLLIDLFYFVEFEKLTIFFQLISESNNLVHLYNMLSVIGMEMQLRNLIILQDNQQSLIDNGVDKNTLVFFSSNNGSAINAKTGGKYMFHTH